MGPCSEFGLTFIQSRRSNETIHIFIYKNNKLARPNENLFYFLMTVEVFTYHVGPRRGEGGGRADLGGVADIVSATITRPIHPPANPLPPPIRLQHSPPLPSAVRCPSRPHSFEGLCPVNWVLVTFDAVMADLP